MGLLRENAAVGEERDADWLRPGATSAAEGWYRCAQPQVLRAVAVAASKSLSLLHMAALPPADSGPPLRRGVSMPRDGVAVLRGVAATPERALHSALSGPVKDSARPTARHDARPAAVTRA